MKKKFAVLLAVLLVFSAFAGTNALALDSSASVTLDAAPLDSQAVIRDDTVYVPVRSVCETLGYKVIWSEESGLRTVTLQKNGEEIVLDLTNQEIHDRGHSFFAPTDSSIMIFSDRTYMASVLFDLIFSTHTKYDYEENRVDIWSVCENSISISVGKIEYQEKYLKTTIQYPQISGLSDSLVQASINSVFKQAALDAESEGRKNAAAMEESFEEGYAGGLNQCETYFDYSIKYNRNGLLSVVLTDYQYCGGAHGLTEQSSYTFDLLTGKNLSIEDLMQSGSGYRDYISSAIRKEIDKKEAAGELVEIPGTRFSDIGANPAFFLSNDGFVLYFQQYEYFPYAAGIQEFTIGYCDLKGMLKPEYRFLYSDPITLDPDTVNQLTVGDIGRITLSGNPTTGYTWHYEISDESVISPVCQSYSSSAKEGIVGAGGIYGWSFKALKAGEATITFRYYRDWEGQASAAQTAVIKVSIR